MECHMTSFPRISQRDCVLTKHLTNFVRRGFLTLAHTSQFAGSLSQIHRQRQLCFVDFSFCIPEREAPPSRSQTSGEHRPLNNDTHIYDIYSWISLPAVKVA